MSVHKKKKDWWIIPLLSMMFIYAAFTFSAQSDDIRLLNMEIKQIERKIDKEKELKQKLLKEKDEILSDESIEKIAREKLGMIRDGERIFIDTNQ